MDEIYAGSEQVRHDERARPEAGDKEAWNGQPLLLLQGHEYSPHAHMQHAACRMPHPHRHPHPPCTRTPHCDTLHQLRKHGHNEVELANIGSTSRAFNSEVVFDEANQCFCFSEAASSFDVDHEPVRHKLISDAVLCLQGGLEQLHPVTRTANPREFMWKAVRLLMYVFMTFIML